MERPVCPVMERTETKKGCILLQILTSKQKPRKSKADNTNLFFG